MRYAVLILVGVLAFAVACFDDEEPPLAPDAAPMAEIDDGAHAGNEHFYFLPPMVDQPSYSGIFDGSLEPVVMICKCNLSDGKCGPALDIYNVHTGPGSETVRVVPEDEHYIVNWHTEEILETFPLEEGEVYRIRVMVDNRELGHADVEVVENGRELKNVDTGEYIGLLDGKTLPMKYRIEEGALEQENPMVSAGNGHSCGVMASGDVYCWGWNGEGRLGAGFVSDHEATPVLVAGDHTFESVSAGYAHTCGLTTGGKAYCWGGNAYGQLGIGSSTQQVPTPQPVTGDHTFTFVSAGRFHTCGVTTDGSTYCWGLNDRGQLGIGVTGGNEPEPQLVVDGHTYETATAGQFHTCATTIDGDAYCWGYNSNGQLGSGSTGGNEPVPQLVTGEHIFLETSLGDYHTCGLTTGGDAYCWGYNYFGQVGGGPGWYTISEPKPRLVTGGYTFETVSAGSEHACGVTATGEAYCWGHNGFGQLGTGFYSYRESTLQLVTGGNVFQGIDGGQDHTCGLAVGGGAYCWGYNRGGQLGIGYTSWGEPAPQFVLDLDPASP